MGVSYAETDEEFVSAIKYAQETTKSPIIIEEYVEGQEISIETISFNGEHFIVQLTEKESSGPPHFTEIAHHQPAILNNEALNKIHLAVPLLLKEVGFMNGAAHIEMKITPASELYLIEVNARGGGGCISSRLVQLSTGYDYIKGMILSAMGEKWFPLSTHKACAGIYFLCKQAGERLSSFIDGEDKSWLIEKTVYDWNLKDSLSNYDRQGYLIYRCNHRIVL